MYSFLYKKNKNLNFQKKTPAYRISEFQPTSINRPVESLGHVLKMKIDVKIKNIAHITSFSLLFSENHRRKMI